MESLWQKNWLSFADLLRDNLAIDECLDELLPRICGKTVTWYGTVEKIDLDNLAPVVYVALPAQQFDLNDGRTATIDGVSLPISDEARSAWTRVAEGDEIRFEAVMGPGQSPFPPVSVKTFRSCKTLITIRLSKGRLL
ncbi:hypothetical protein GC176_14030 [bacterium]|nr:hypothetical protein [bacterium]